MLNSADKEFILEAINSSESKMEKGFKNVWKELRRLNENLDATITFFDSDIVKLKKEMRTHTH